MKNKPRHPKDDELPPCIICKKVWKRHETDKYVYHESFGVACICHHGVADFYETLLQEARNYLDKN